MAEMASSSFKTLRRFQTTSWGMPLNKCGRKEGKTITYITYGVYDTEISSSVIFFRYNELLFIIDTCQAASMFRTFYSPNIVATGSSSVNEDSLSVSLSKSLSLSLFSLSLPSLPSLRSSHAHTDM